VRHKSKLSIKD